jgi:hypothetical protein
MRTLRDKWYGRAPFKPEDRGSVPHLPDDPHVLTGVRRAMGVPEGVTNLIVQREAERRCREYNAQWRHHLNDEDVAALIESGYLWPLTHTRKGEHGWHAKEPACMPSARDVNMAVLEGRARLDAVAPYVVARAYLARRGIDSHCPECHGEGELWPSEEVRVLAENWQPDEPPAGEAFQLWDNEECCPLSPAFPVLEELTLYVANQLP